MWENGCHAVSTPALPSTHSSPVWEHWDYTLDIWYKKICFINF
jgi:hypothetical protein